MTFPCRQESIGSARRLVREVLADRPRETVENVTLMVSELATNCVRHARSDFDLEIAASEGEIRVTVRDRGQGSPRVRSPGPLEPTGRGLRVVDALAREWGIEHQTDGKSVWFVVPARRERTLHVA